MRKNKKNPFNKNLSFNLLLVVITFLITVLAIITGSYIQEGYTLKVGSISPKRFIAPKEVENKLATQKKITEAENSVMPLFKLDPEIETKVIEQLDSFFDEIDILIKEQEIAENTRAMQTSGDEVNLENDDSIENSLNSGNVDNIGNNENIDGVDDINVSSIKTTTQRFTSIPVFLSQLQYDLYRSFDAATKQNFIDVVIDIASTVMGQGVKDDDTKSFLLAKDEFNKQPWDDMQKELGYAIVSSVLEPNLVLDSHATQQAKLQKAADVEPVILYAGEKIVDENERITEEIFEILDSLNLINEGNKQNYIPIVGAMLTILILQIFTYIYIYSFNKKILSNKKESLLLFTLYLGAIVVLRFMASVAFTMIPLIIFVMLVSTLIDSKLAIILNYVISITGVLISKGDLEFLIFFSITGTMASILIKYTYERNKVILVGVVISLVNALVVLGLGLLFQKNFSTELLYSCLFSIFTGVLAVIITIGSLPFWEAVFDVITPLKLLELTNPNNPVLRRLMIEAPGTYHHSLIVANLAETAAYDINANATLARVGGYYHDMGKLKYPHYFSENQMGDNPHDMMEPAISAKVIIQHATTGLEMAGEYRLPKAIKDIVIQHHGTTLTKYFYYKAKKLFPDDSIDEKKFQYPGPIPQSKEAAIVMLADTVEAAIRSKKSEDKHMNVINSELQVLIKAKLDDGQLNDSELTIKDLETIRSAFARVFHGMYHDRVPYPKDDKPKSAEGVVEVES